MIWLAQRAVALVVIIIGSQILFRLLRSWWLSKAWLRAASVFLLNCMWRMFAAVTLLVALCTPIGWIALFLDWRKRYGPIARSLDRPLSMPQPNRVDHVANQFVLRTPADRETPIFCAGKVSPVFRRYVR
jgi:hypothetical protein